MVFCVRVCERSILEGVNSRTPLRLDDSGDLAEPAVSHVLADLARG